MKQSESEQIVQAIKPKGIPYEYLLFPDEGHGFASGKSHEILCAVEQFLAKHMAESAPVA